MARRAGGSAPSPRAVRCRLRGAGSSALAAASPSPFTGDIAWPLVLSDGTEARMPRWIVWGPFEELELPDQFRPNPATFPHLFGRQACSPASALRLWRFAKGHVGVSS